MKTIQILLSASLFILTSCQSQKQPALTTINILDGLKTEKEFRLSEIVDNVEYVKLETSKECIFPFASFSVGKTFILAINPNDPEQIFLFDRKGGFIRKIGGKGKGPLEYTSLLNVVADPEETYILVNDYQRKTIIKYGFEGKVISTFPYKEKFDGTVSDIVIKTSNEIFFQLDYPRLEKKNFYLIRKMDGNFNQIDSLYPVNTTPPESSGYFWGGSDFYLSDGSIHFRQFSFDTLYSERNGKMVPLFLFPIHSDHLPGPILVPELHKQIYDYTSILKIIDLSDYLILNTRIVPKKGGVMVFCKSSGEIFKLKKISPCPPDTIERRLFINDIDGIGNPMYLSRENKLFIVTHEIVDLKEQLAGNCSEIRDIKFPGKRQEFIGLINAGNEDDNPILQIFHLR